VLYGSSDNEKDAVEESGRKKAKVEVGGEEKDTATLGLAQFRVL
jgi:hypothetical protein